MPIRLLPAAKFSTSKLTTQAPPRPPFLTLGIAILTSIAPLTALVALGTVSGHVLLIPPMAASMALVAGAPTLPLAQPRNVIGGQFVSAVVGVVVGMFSHSMWAAAIAAGLALGAMLATRTSHSPAVATTVIGTLTASGQVEFVVLAALAAVVLVAAGWIGSRLSGMTYPTYWW